MSFYFPTGGTTVTKRHRPALPGENTVRALESLDPPIRPTRYQDGPQSTLGVEQGIGKKPAWMTMRNHKGYRHRVKSPKLPVRSTWIQAQADLDSYATDKGMTAAENTSGASIAGSLGMDHENAKPRKGESMTTKAKAESGKRKAESCRVVHVTRPRISGLTANGVRHLPAATINLIPVEEIYRSPFQTREFDPIDNPDIHQLAETIKNHGLLQPIVVRLVGDHYELIAGERRLRACRLAKIERIPAKIVEVDDKDAATLCALENLQRKDLNAIERAKSIKQLAGLGLKQTEIGKQLGLSQSGVANELRLLKLPNEWQQRIISGEISPRHGRAVLPYLKDERIVRAAADWLLAHPDGARVEHFETWLGMLESGGQGTGDGGQGKQNGNGDGKPESRVPSPEPRDSSPESRVANPRALDRQLDDEARAEKRWNNDIERLEARINGLLNCYGDDADYMEQLADTLTEYAKSCVLAAKALRKKGGK